MKYKLLLLSLVFAVTSQAQDVALYNQLNGRYDFTFVGNTLNPQENSYMFVPAILESSSADLTLAPDDTILKAYLYWAGSGTGDFQVELNGQAVSAERTFAFQRITLGTVFDYFSAFTDITSFIQSTGNGTYTLTGLDIGANLQHNFQNRTNFAGWAILVVYENPNLPLNQLNIYDGLQAVPEEINITLNSLNVIDNNDAKIGFLAWEGDVDLADNERLRINGNPLSNALNPEENAFNGTNSFTGSDELYNMDLDVYTIENNINIGDTSAQIQITSDWDVVMINVIVTKLNSQLPDATIIADEVNLQCESRVVSIEFTVNNFNSTAVLPSATPISIYADGIFVQYTETILPIPIGGSEIESVSFVLPDGIPPDFELTLVVDDDGTGAGTVTEIVETNNTFVTNVSLLFAPIVNELPEVKACNLGGFIGTFDFSGHASIATDEPDAIVTFHPTEDDALSGTNPITNPSAYTAPTDTTIYVRIVGANGCSAIGNFMLKTRNCPPTVYNYISPNGDNTNDNFHVDGLYGIFPRFDINIYNRWGVRVWTGNQATEKWDGTATEGALWNGDQVPSGTYYYLIDLYDADYPNGLSGWLFLSR